MVRAGTVWVLGRCGTDHRGGRCGGCDQVDAGADDIRLAVLAAARIGVDMRGGRNEVYLVEQLRLERRAGPAALSRERVERAATVQFVSR